MYVNTDDLEMVRHQDCRFHQVGLIDREHEPGSRRDHHRVRDDVWHEATVRRDRMLARWDTTLREGVVALGEDTPAGSRLNETLQFFAFLQKELPALLDRWHQYQAESARDGGTQ
jgi:DNA-binding transcriptional regulator GbsR (MarR family)